MKKVSLVFPGQGSQYEGMGKKVYERYNFAKQIFEEANDILKYDIREICFGKEVQKLNNTEFTQSAILVTSYMYFRSLQEELNIIPEFMAGHSLGEITALTCAEVIKFGDAVKLVKKRGELMSKPLVNGKGAMLAVMFTDDEYIDNIFMKVDKYKEYLQIANYNSPNQIVISGYDNIVNEIEKEFIDDGCKVKKLKVSIPAHSFLMNNAALEFSKEILEINYNDFKYNVLSSSSQCLFNKNNVSEILTKQMITPVYWSNVMKFFELNDVNIVLEIGPGKVLKNLARKYSKSFEISSFDEENFSNIVRNYLSTNIENSNERNKENFITQCITMALCCKNINSNEEEYRCGVINPYNELCEIDKELRLESKILTENDMDRGIQLLKTILDTKKVSEGYKTYCLNELSEIREKLKSIK